MKISVFGLGYVGTVCAGCLAVEGHEIVGVDPVQLKVDFINQGHSPIVEPEIDGIIARYTKTGGIRATTDPLQAVMESDLSFVCVGTPSLPNGDLDLRFIRRICEQIGEALRTKIHTTPS